MKTVTLHGHATSPNALKVAIVLEYLKIPYDIEIWEIGDDPVRGLNTGKFLTKLSPNGRVPVLVDPNTGVHVWESGAIINYLKRQYDTSNLLGPHGSSEPSLQAIAELEQWEMLLLTTLAPMTGQLVWFA